MDEKPNLKGFFCFVFSRQIISFSSNLRAWNSIKIAESRSVTAQWTMDKWDRAYCCRTIWEKSTSLPPVTPTLSHQEISKIPSVISYPSIFQWFSLPPRALRKQIHLHHLVHGQVGLNLLIQYLPSKSWSDRIYFKFSSKNSTTFFAYSSGWV